MAHENGRLGLGALTLCAALLWAPEWGLAQPTAAPSATALSQMHVPRSLAEWSRGAQLFEGLDRVHRSVSTSSPAAQRYFDQGLALMWGFNHDEATRSFAKAAEIDPRCAACLWAVSLTVGPNYNLPFMTAERARVARQALIRAQAQRPHASPVEQALIGALAKRYPTAQPLDPVTAQPVLSAYAKAMRGVAARFPDDLDVRTLYAESLMNLHAWKLWKPDGEPAAGTPAILAELETVLARDPNHVGANHYYVHTLEASPHPEKAVAAAERLKDLVPGAGHLVHMPAHIFHRLGRYEDAAEANRRAAVEDHKYLGRTMPPDYYPVMYTAHNYQFLAYSAAMEGRKAETLEAADRSRESVADALLLEMPGADWYVAELYAARVRFGLWQELLALPAPDRRLDGLTTGYLYGRAMALAATNRVTEARGARDELTALAARIPADAGAGQNLLKDVCAVAAPMIEARIAAAEHRPHDAIRALRRAVEAEDRLSYDEPRDWFVPSRHALGAMLLGQNAVREAEEVFRADLAQSPDNGWALHGLAAALEAQGRRAEADAARKSFERAWQHADIALTAAAY